MLREQREEVAELASRELDALLEGAGPGHQWLKGGQEMGPGGLGCPQAAQVPVEPKEV